MPKTVVAEHHQFPGSGKFFHGFPLEDEVFAVVQSPVENIALKYEEAAIDAATGDLGFFIEGSDSVILDH